MEQVGVKDNYRLVQNLKSAGCFIVCILLTLVCLVPLYLMIVNACRGHNAILQSPVSLIPGSNFVENMKNITTHRRGGFADTQGGAVPRQVQPRHRIPRAHHRPCE